MLEKLEDMNVDIVDGIIGGEYKDYEFEIDEDNVVTVGGKLQGEKPAGVVKIITTDEVALEVKLQVIGAIKGDNTITKIEAMDKEKAIAIDDASNRYYITNV